ncbi:MAG TPA: hypothetical protein P5076_21805, partial [Myxococcota bacterium]|nr:hypothetical protein [Myxococcota bacterium]
APNDLLARRNLLELVECDRGRPASLELARRWVAERPGDDEVELLLYETLRRQTQTREADTLLRARLRRNPEDAWAWRELGFRLLDRESAESPAGVDRAEELRQAVARAVALSPGAPATRMLQAEQASARGEHAEAVAWTLEALAVAPELGGAYLHALAASAGLDQAAQEAVLERLEEHLERCPGRLHPARDLVLQLAGLRGPERAQRTLDRLARRGAEDPEWLEAQADLWLEGQGGQTQAGRALELLERACARFPAHFDLRLSYTHALRLLGREQAEVEVLEALVRWNPTHLGARHSLARLHLQRGQAQLALDLLGEGARMRPQDRQVFRMWAQLARDAGRPQEAIRCGRRGIALQPDNLALREQVLALHLELGEHEQALQLARAGTLQESAPAYAWVLLARALDRHPGHTTRGEAEAEYREALRRDGQLYDAADELAVLLAHTGRIDEARALLEPLRQRLADPCPALARLAWLEREAGQGRLAVERMAEVLRRWPGHRFALWQLLHWLEEDKAYALALELLPELPAPARIDAELVARWLGLMERAGLQPDVLERHWQGLLAEHPADLGLHLLRSDWLAERRHWSEALAVLASVEGKQPESAFLVARKVGLLALSARPDEALAEARRLWVLPGDDEGWPDQAAWNDLREAGLRERATAELLGLALGGTRVRRASLAELVESVGILDLRLGEAEALGMPFQAANARGAGHLVKLYRALAEAPWDRDAQLRALALGGLVRRGRDAPELERWLQAFLDAQRQELGAHTPLWRQAVWFAAYRPRPDPAGLRTWLAGWDERPGVDMTAAAWLVDGLRRTLLRSPPAEALEELAALSARAIERLEPDSTAGYLACVLGECGARLERPELVRAALEHGQRFWAGRQMDDILPGGSPWTPQALALLDELGRASSPRELVVLSGRLGQLHGTKGLGRLRRAWRRWLRARCGPWARLRAGLAYWWRHLDG